MPAPLGHKTWTPLDVLTAADLNGHVADQVIGVYASSVTRDAELPSPAVGMHCYLVSTALTYRWNGAQWLTTTVMPNYASTTARDSALGFAAVSGQLAYTADRQELSVSTPSGFVQLPQIQAGVSQASLGGFASVVFPTPFATSSNSPIVSLTVLAVEGDEHIPEMLVGLDGEPTETGFDFSVAAPVGTPVDRPVHWIAVRRP